MSGSVCIMAQQTARYSAFAVCLTQLRCPPNTKIDWVFTTDVAGGRNTLVKRALESGAEWCLFLDDDQSFPPDLLLKLLSHEKDIVSALYVQRAGGHGPLAFSERTSDNTYTQVDLTALPGEGLLKVHACGAGGLLIRSEVFHAISDKPTWFQYGLVFNETWNASEDIIFCEKAQKAGFEVFVDLGCPIGHMAPTAIWPQFIDNQWCLGFSVADGTQLYVPIEPQQEEPARYEEVASA